MLTMLFRSHASTGEEGEGEYYEQDAGSLANNGEEEEAVQQGDHDAVPASDDCSWESSSTESRSLVLPHNHWMAASRLSGTCYKPAEVRTFMGHMTVPHLKRLCTLWHLPKTGTKAILLERLYTHLMSALDSPISGTGAEPSHDRPVWRDNAAPSSQKAAPSSPKTLAPSPPPSAIPCKRGSPRRSAPPRPASTYSILLAELNDEYARYNSAGWRPFQMPPVTISGEYLCLLEDYEWDYALPYPWILEQKLSPPILTSLVHDISASISGGGAVNISVSRPTLAGVRLLLVAIKYRTEEASDKSTVDTARHGPGDTNDAESRPRPTAGRRVLANLVSTHPRIAWPPSDYRHAYIRDFQCTFDGLHYGGGRYETSTVHQVTSYLTGSSAPGRTKESAALWTLRPDLLPTRMTGPTGAARRTTADRGASEDPSEGRCQEGYFLQIVAARRNPAEWLCWHQRTIRTKPAALVMAQIRRDFYSTSAAGISTSAIRISLRCPLSLQRMTTPVRSRRCRHPQCWELSSSLTGLVGEGQHPPSAYEQESPVYRCPVCDVSVAPDALFVDGLVEAMLQQCPQVDEVIIDTETGTWRAIGGVGRERDRSSGLSSPTQNSRVSEKSTPSLVDLTLTPDEPIDPAQVAAVYFKADPGGQERDGPKEARTVVPSELSATPAPVANSDTCDQQLVMLDEADVVQSEAWHLDAAPINVPSRPHPPSGSQRGTSAFDAIIID